MRRLFLDGLTLQARRGAKESDNRVFPFDRAIRIDKPFNRLTV